MSQAHRHPEYVKNSKLLRQSTNVRIRRGEYVPCGRCGGPIMTTIYDIGHRIDVSRGGTHELSNLRPEHRRCNRAAGGVIGAKRTNAKRSRTHQPSTEGHLQW